jgi:putative SOS response-associated peptidase YedK
LWEKSGGRKQPFFFRMRDERPFGFAGLWERWEGEGGQVVNSCAILTTKANELLRPVHDRMPVILHPDDYELRLDGDARELDLVREVLRPYPAEEMTGYPVGVSVNSPSSRGSKLIARAAVNSVLCNLS